MGEAKILATDTIGVTDKSGKISEIKTKNIVIATGASAMVPTGWRIDGKRVVTYLEAILQEDLPQSAIIIGAGAIGVEFATIWNSYGSDVTIVEMLPNLLPLEDEDISKELSKSFIKQGIDVLTGHRVESLEATKDSVNVKVTNENDEKILKAEQALVAIGFTPNSANLDLEEVGVTISEQGAIKIDDRMETNIPGIWAIGDVTGKLMLAHVSSLKGLYALRVSQELKRLN